MPSSAPVSLWEHEALLHRTKTFEYSRYHVDHPDARGILRLATIPADVLRADKSKARPGFAIDGDGEYIVTTSTTVMFVNRGEKKTPTENAGDASSRKKASILQYLVKEQTDEPWCEYVVQDRPGELLRIRTILTDVYYYPGVITSIGDPLIRARHTTSVAVTDNIAAESGTT